MHCQPADLCIEAGLLSWGTRTSLCYAVVNNVSHLTA